MRSSPHIRPFPYAPAARSAEEAGDAREDRRGDGGDRAGRGEALGLGEARGEEPQPRGEDRIAQRRRAKATAPGRAPRRSRRGARRRGRAARRGAATRRPRRGRRAKPPCRPEAAGDEVDGGGEGVGEERRERRDRRRGGRRPRPRPGSSMASARASRTALGRLATKSRTQASIRWTSALPSLRPRAISRAIAARGARQPWAIASTRPLRPSHARRRASQPASRSRMTSAMRGVLDLGDRLVDEGEDQQLLGRAPRDAARGQVEERRLVDGAGGGAVAALDVVGVDLELGLGEELARLVEQQALADLVAVGLLRHRAERGSCPGRRRSRRCAAPS